MPITTKIGGMVTYYEGLLPIDLQWAPFDHVVLWDGVAD